MPPDDDTLHISLLALADVATAGRWTRHELTACSNLDALNLSHNNIVLHGGVATALAKTTAGRWARQWPTASPNPDALNLTLGGGVAALLATALLELALAYKFGVATMHYHKFGVTMFYCKRKFLENTRTS